MLVYLKKPCVTLSILEWSKLVEIKYEVLLWRYNQNWAPEDILNPFIGRWS